MIIELKGTLKVIFAEEQINEKLNKKQIVITIDEDTQYPQDITLEAINNGVRQLDSFNMGQRVVATAYLKGRENKGKYYNQLTLKEINLS